MYAGGKNLRNLSNIYVDDDTDFCFVLQRAIRVNVLMCSGMLFVSAEPHPPNVE